MRRKYLSSSTASSGASSVPDEDSIISFNPVTLTLPSGLFTAIAFPRYTTLSPMIYMMSPNASGCCPFIMRPFTNVPFMLPRSLIVADPPEMLISACFGETNLFPKLIVLDASLPIVILSDLTRYFLNCVFPSVTAWAVSENTCPSGNSQFTNSPSLRVTLSTGFSSCSITKLPWPDNVQTPSHTSTGRMMSSSLPLIYGLISSGTFLLSTLGR